MQKKPGPPETHLGLNEALAKQKARDCNYNIHTGDAGCSRKEGKESKVVKIKKKNKKMFVLKTGEKIDLFTEVFIRKP